MNKISYLQARDPSIVSWNRGNLRRINLKKELEETSQEEQPDEHINVFLRIKGPSLNREYYEVNDNVLICKQPEGCYSTRNLAAGLKMTSLYTFSNIFGPKSTQQEMFNSIVKWKILDVINGKNSTLFTYGTSGSGKTHTIVGTPEQPGLIPRALEYLFRSLPDLRTPPEFKPLPNGTVELLRKSGYVFLERRKHQILLETKNIQNTVDTYRLMQDRLSIENPAEISNTEDLSVSVWVSFAEIYNENIYDLLDNFSRKKERTRLKLGQNSDRVYIRDLSSVNVVNGMEAYQILQYGLQHLNYASTLVNSHSSRSHGIFTIKLVQFCRSTKTTQISCFHFCDLAGSERLKKTLNAGERLKESNNINLSLHVLGRCIQAVKKSQKSKNSFVPPFRESKLTQLFQNALSGKENISIIINLNPAPDMIEESRHALDFSALTREISIQEKPLPITHIKNRFSELIDRDRQSIISNEQEIRRLREEVERLESVVVELNNEIQELNAEKDLEIREEKEYVKEMYETFIKNKKIRDNELNEREKQRIREKYEDEIKSLKEYIKQLLAEREDVINISSSSSENSFCDKRAYEEEIEALKRENKSLNKLLIEKDEIISEAKEMYWALEQKLTELQKDNKELLIRNFKLQEGYTDMGSYSSTNISDDESSEENLPINPVVSTELPRKPEITIEVPLKPEINSEVKPEIISEVKPEIIIEVQPEISIENGVPDLNVTMVIEPPEEERA